MKRAADTEVSLPSPPAESSQSPEPSDEFHAAGPPRKRSRSGTSPEDRKEARAHRNRIAAQNSRDRRKAQFAYLEHRVAELEEENRQLRAGMGLMGLRRADEDRIDEQREKDKARDVENEELRERIRTLEAGWDAVVKALAASGLPLNIPSAPPPPTTSSSSSTRSSSQPPTTAFPVLVPPSPVSVFTTSPSLSESCSPSSSTKSFPLDFDSFASTRHLAAGGPGFLSNSNDLQLELELDSSTTVSLPTSGAQEPSSAMDETAMEDLLREILAPSPTLSSTSLPTHTSANVTRSRSDSASAYEGAPPSHQNSPSTASGTASSIKTPITAVDWEGHAQMQRLLDILPVVQPDADTTVNDTTNMVEFPSALDLQLEGWDLDGVLNAPMGQEIGVF